MKRDFQDEYQSYIESDIPDLWARIEPNLADKKSVIKKSKKWIHFVKTAIPIAACLCVLVIGARVMQLSGQNKDMGAQLLTEAGKEACADEPMEETAEAESEAPAKETAEAESEAPAKETAETENKVTVEEAVEAEGDTALGVQNSMTVAEPGSEEAAMDSGNKNAACAEDSLSRQSVKVEKAVLTKIAVASENMQDAGFAYVYTFRMEDDSSLLVYLTKQQCLDMEEKGTKIVRQEAYALTVIPYESGEELSDTCFGEGILKKIEKLP